MEQKRTRRTHTKSKNGCHNCKTRRVKCDEARPICGFCKKRDFECHFDDPETTRKSSTDSSLARGSSSDGDTDQSITISLIPKQRCRLEMRLIHHFTTATCGEIVETQGGSIREMWREYLPKMAFDDDTLLEALLAVSAAHMSILQPDDYSMARIADKYFASAVAKHRQALTDTQAISLNAEAVFGTTFLIAFHTAVNANRMEPPSDRYQDLLSWFAMYQSIKNIMGTLWRNMRGRSLANLIESYPESRIDGPKTYLLIAAQSKDLFAYVLKGPFEPDEDEETLAAYTTMLQLIEWIYEAVWNPDPDKGYSIKEVFRRFSVAPMLAPPNFVEKIQQERPRAVAILAHYVAITHFIEGQVWWLPRTVDLRVKALADTVPPEWQWALDWPLHIVGCSDPSMVDPRLSQLELSMSCL